MKQYLLNCSEMLVLVLVLSSTCYDTFVSGSLFFCIFASSDWRSLNFFRLSDTCWTISAAWRYFPIETNLDRCCSKRDIVCLQLAMSSDSSEILFCRISFSSFILLGLFSLAH